MVRISRVSFRDISLHPRAALTRMVAGFEENMTRTTKMDDINVANGITCKDLKLAKITLYIVHWGILH